MVSILGQSIRTGAHIQSLQSRMFQRQGQISSGKISENFSGLKYNSRLSINFRNATGKLESYQNNITLTKLRLDHMEPTMLRIADIATSMRDEILKRKDDSEPDMVLFQNVASNLLNEMNNLMNKQVDGEYLFAGIATDTQPMLDPTAVLGNVQALIAGYTTPADAITRHTNVVNYLDANIADYYGGDTSATGLSTRVDDGLDLDYAPRADDPAFRAVLRGLYIASTLTYDGANEDGFWQIMDQVADDLKTGFDAVTNITADIGYTQAQLERISIRHDKSLFLFQRQIGEVEDVDAAEAIQQFQLLQTQLQASYQAISEIRDLQLTNFL